MNFFEPYESLVASPRDFAKSYHFPDPSRIKILDCTLRDGEQMPGVAFSPTTKYELIKAMSDLGVHAVEVGFPAVSAAERKAIELAVQGKRRGELRPDLDLIVLCRTVAGDVDVAIKGLREAGIDPSEVTFCAFTSASDLHLKYKVGRVLMRQEGRPEAEYFEAPLAFFRQANIRLLVDIVKYIRGYGTGPVQMMAEDASRADLDYIIQLYRAGLEAGGFRPTLTDTVGCGIPEHIGHYAGRMVEALGADAQVCAHFHNDFGLATINNIAAAAQGVEVISGSFNAIGERAGNASIQEFVAALRWLYGVELPGFRYERLRDISRLVARHAGVPIGANQPIIGASVFLHESGVHTAGVLIDPRIYQSVPAEGVGAETGYRYGKHSGSLIVRFALEKHRAALASAGVEITEDLVRRVNEEIKQLREQMAESDYAERIADKASAAMAGLGLTDEDVARIALAASHNPHTH